jgi:2-methylcitrate dehydratase PrpD
MLVERIVSYAMQLRYEDITPEALQIAKWLVFDSIGTGLGGYQTPLGKKTVAFVETTQAGDQATLLGSGGKATLGGAAFGNATMIKILGMDDSHRSAGHIASQLIPAVLAVAENRGTSGRSLLTAIVAAYDLAVRLGFAVRLSQRQRGLDLKGTVGAITAALGAGLCAGLTGETLSHAVALAADMASGTEQYVYESGPCDTKDLVAGFGARGGVFAVELAEHGFFGPRGAIDGEYGFLRAFGDGSGAEVFDDLGDSFAITSTAFKPHGGCRHTHQAVDAIQQILAGADVASHEIERVVVKTYQYALQPFFRVDPNPGSREVAGLSIRVASAVALAHGSAWPRDYRHWDDPEVRRLRQLVEIEIDPEIEGAYPDQNGCRLEVVLKDGSSYQGYVPYAKGEPEFRMGEAELREKFAALTSEILSAERADELFERCMRLETLGEVGQLLQLASSRKEVIHAS